MAHIQKIVHTQIVEVFEQVANVDDTFTLNNKTYVAKPTYGTPIERFGLCKGCAFITLGSECMNAPNCSNNDVIFVEQGEDNGNEVEA